MARRLTYEELEQRVMELEAIEVDCRQREQRLQKTIEDLVNERTVKLQEESTRRRETEESLAESVRRYRLLAECMSDVIWTSNMDLRFTYLSPSVKGFLGYDPEELMGQSILTHLTPASAEAAANPFLEMLTKGDTESPDTLAPTRMELARLHKDGSEVWGEVEWAILRDRLGRPIEILGVTRDITERKRVERALVKAEARWRSMTENAPDFIMVLDAAGIIQFINRSVYQPKEQVIGSSILDLTDEKHKPVVKELLERVRRTGQPGCAESLYLSPEGVSAHFEIRIGPVFDAGRVVAFMVNGTDITDRKRMEEEIARTQQLKSIAVMAGGIAHDLNNILTPILANISTARMCGELDDGIAELLIDAEKATIRAKGLAQQLLTFAKGGDPITKTIKVSESVRQSAKFALSGSSAGCEFSLPEDLWLVDADEGQLGQVIQNLVINAQQAMADGGGIKISAENLIVKDDPLVRTEDGRCVRISLEDQGCGIPEKYFSKIFDPFFTTKEKGRGLGLSTSFSIVKRHGGHMRVSSEVGVGTRVDIYLPASSKTSASEDAESPKPVRGEGRVLIIDDDDNVRRAASGILKRLGFEVEVAGDGQEGIKLYRKEKDLGRPFRAVVMDLTIPGGMGGKRAIQKLMEIDPQAKVIVSSGYSDDPVLSSYRDYGFSEVLTKPYNAEELAMVLHRVMSDI